MNFPILVFFLSLSHFTAENNLINSSSLIIFLPGCQIYLDVKCLAEAYSTVTPLAEIDLTGITIML